MFIYVNSTVSEINVRNLNKNRFWHSNLDNMLKIDIIKHQITERLYVFIFLRSTTITVQVDITGTGTRPPIIPASVYTLSISEGTTIGTSIFTIPVSYS